MRLNPDRLEQTKNEASLDKATNVRQTIHLPGEDVQAFLDFKENQRIQKERGVPSSSSSSQSAASPNSEVSPIGVEITPVQKNDMVSCSESSITASLTVSHNCLMCLSYALFRESHGSVVRDFSHRSV